LTGALRELLDAIGRHLQPEDIAVELEHAVHLAYADGNM
jgi:hypothetical protein